MSHNKRHTLRLPTVEPSEGHDEAPDSIPLDDNHRGQPAPDFAMLARRSLLGTSSFVCRSCIRQHRSQLRRSYATSPNSSSTSSTSNIYDVVCVGGGPAGLSLLTALRTNRYSSFPELPPFRADLTRKSQDPTPSPPTSKSPSSKPKISPPSNHSTSPLATSPTDAAPSRPPRAASSTPSAPGSTYAATASSRTARCKSGTA